MGPFNTPIPNGISQRLALPQPKPKPHLSLQKDVLLQLDVPRPDPESKLSLKRTSEAHTNPDAIIHQDLLVHFTASGNVHWGSKCTSVHHDLEISISDEDETCIPSPAVLPDQRDITSSLATEVAQCHFHSAQAPASGMGYKQSSTNRLHDSIRWLQAVARIS